VDETMVVRFVDLPEPERLDRSRALPEPTWERVLSEEPEIGAVIEELRSIRPRRRRWRLFVERHGTTPKAHLCKLVGWHARNPRLRSEATYELTMRRMWDLVL
jgi:hypothetical protein